MNWNCLASGGATVGLALLVGCGGPDGDPNLRVSGYREGRYESELRREVGAPTHERNVAEKDRGSCEGTPATRELVYDVPSRGAKLRVRKMLRMRPAFSYVLCVDRAGRIVRFSTVHID